MSRVILVGLIDSGVAVSQQHLVMQARAFYWQNNQLQITDAQIDGLGHGSAITNAIIDQAPNAKLMIAQVFNQRLVTTTEQVVAALNWLVEQGAEVINMSFGLRSDRPLLRAACQRAIAKGVCLVGSAPASGGGVYPSAYSGVIKVTGDARCDGDEFSHLNTAQADFGACVRSPVDEFTGLSLAGASVASAFMTGHIANYLTEQAWRSGENIADWLSKTAHYKALNIKINNLKPF